MFLHELFIYKRNILITTFSILSSNIGCGITTCDSCSKMEQCGACQAFFCPSCQRTTQCRDCDTRCCGQCMTSSCKSCGERICPSCNNEEGPSFSTTCQICKETLCRLCVPTCSQAGCSKEICRDCRNKRSGCGSCSNYFCDDHQHQCSVGDCTTVYCLSCIDRSYSDANDETPLGEYCDQCSNFAMPSFLCTGCYDNRKLGSCSECEYAFDCANEACTVGGRNQRWCKACNVRYCSECSTSHKDKCKAPDDPHAEVIWFDQMNDKLHFRMNRFYRQPYVYVPHRDHRFIASLLDECPREIFFTLPLQKKISFAEKVFAVIRKYKSEEILDIGTVRVQPRIDSKFKKKNTVQRV